MKNKEKKMTQKYFRHGDVHIVESDIPSDAVETKDKVLEHGEVTGHAHRFTSDNAVVLTTKDNRKFLRVVAPTDLRHEEHHTRVIPPGTYEIRRTRETDHMSGVVRQVAD